MPIPAYVQGFPQTGSSLGSTKTQIRDNLDGTFLTLEVDHYDNNGQCPSAPTTTGTAGNHSVIHMTTQGSDPGSFAGGVQLYSKLTTIPGGGVSEIFYKLSNGSVNQLTGGLPASNGYIWVGGILLQWGTTSGAGTITFSPAFPNNCFNVQLTTGVSGATSGAATYAIQSISTTQFKFIFAGGNGSGYGPFYWFAIGN